MLMREKIILQCQVSASVVDVGCIVFAIYSNPCGQDRAGQGGMCGCVSVGGWMTQ